ncbi:MULTISPECIES: hypothetical protein [unclassified Nostoc]|uniref:hypothetical protein n=1 Tax=unclassified Nostoc TaxID=2593658 RepID=UPI0025AB43E3|nr:MULTISPECIES: hypothetical protein [unclassified Nostoc]MDM9585582.1 hypothetical protein [Nostoc sp. GT001]MDZ7946539.1 hypothetical protein [Nostoc sp. EfeVER01]MDZ7996031.1 hypothetical protein [Nostoc sp. EspVER01]
MSPTVTERWSLSVAEMSRSATPTPGITSIESCYCPGYNILTKLGQQRLSGIIFIGFMPKIRET